MRVMRGVCSIVSLLTLAACAMSVAEARQNTPPAASQSSSQNAQQVTVPLSDPSRPATLNVNLVWGGVTIRGTNRKDVLIEAQAAERRNGVYIDGGGFRIG